MKILHGSAQEVLRTLPENSIDVVYTCPSPFQYYNDQNLIGGEENLNDYISNLVQICDECSRVLKPTGNLFIQLDDKFTRLGTLLGIPTKFEMRMVGKEGWALNDRLIWHRCLYENTNLFIKRNNKYEFISISELYNNFSDNVLIPSQDKLGNIIWIKVKNIYYNSKQQTKKIITKSGNEIICTDNHIFPIRRSSSPTKKFRQLSFKRCDELDESDKLYINDKISLQLPEGDNIDYKEGYLIGFYMAEGCWGKINKKTNKPYNIRLCCGKLDFERKNLEIFLDMGKFTYYDYGRGAIEVNTSNKNIINLVLEYINNNGCRIKSFNNTIFNRSIKFLDGIINGFLNGDGYYDKKNHRYVIGLSPNHKLKDQLQVICRILGYDFRFIGDRKSIKKDKQWDNIRFTIRKESKRSYYMGCKLDPIDSVQNFKKLSVFDLELEPYYSGAIGNNQYFKNIDIESKMENKSKYNHLYFLANGAWTHNSETHKRTYQEKGFLKNYEYIFHFIHRDYYFNTKSKYINTSVFSYPLEDSYYTNEFDSGLPTELSKMVIDTCCPPNGVVCDPLCGSAKLGIVAKKMNRDFIGIDINLETVELARIRLGIDG
jgi:DNA modification methylase